MASVDQVDLNDPHAPNESAKELFKTALHKIKHEVIKSRIDWDKHEPRMWSRASALSNEELAKFTIDEDLVEVRSGHSSNADYGTIVFGKIRIPAINDDEGAGFIHVRLHDPPNRGVDDVHFHSIFTDVGPDDGKGHHQWYKAIMTDDAPLRFFNE